MVPNETPPPCKGADAKMNWKQGLVLFSVMMVLSACATVPKGPSVMVWPGPWKPFEVFQSDDAICRQWAAQQIGTSFNDAVNQNLTTGAVLGMLAGAGLGAAIGAASGGAGIGAAIGAASGLIGGTAVASGPAYAAGYEAQRRYDYTYLQCMYAKGNQIPSQRSSSRSVPPPPPPPGFTPESHVPPAHGPYPPAQPPATQ